MPHSSEGTDSLLVLQEKYRRLRLARNANSGTAEASPDASRHPIERFLELSTEVAENYVPSGYLKSAPYRQS